MELMDNSLNDVGDDQPGPSTRRRRSTFFIKRDSIAPQTERENEDDPVFHEREKQDTDIYKKDLERYMDQLLTEKDQWKKEVNERRNKYHDLRQQYQLVAQAPSRSRISYACLSKEDIEFLKNKPNIATFVESQMKFHKSVRQTVGLTRRANELDKVLIERCENKLNRITQYILENSTVDPME